MKLRLAALILALAGCRVSGTFECETNDQCRSSKGTGVCDVGTHFCAFSDADCASGIRYADNAGDGLAGQCQGAADAAVDAPFDTSVCPARFDKTIPSQPNARFSVIIDAGDYGTNANRCLDLLPGASHPANVHSAAQAAELSSLYFGGGPLWVYVGVIQDPAALQVGQGWINFDGTPFDATLWSGTAPIEPDDGDGNENHLQQAAAVSYQDKVGDYATRSAVPMICACDGVPVSPLATQYLAGNVWN